MFLFLHVVPPVILHTLESNSFIACRISEEGEQEKAKARLTVLILDRVFLQLVLPESIGSKKTRTGKLPPREEEQLRRRELKRDW